MNLAAIDLNLLTAFEALLEERNVTRAGQRIGLAQPSMSSALTRLRALFGDELFIRTAAGMQPTARALALARPIGEALAQIRATLAPDTDFDPATARRRLTVAVTDYGDLVVVPALVALLRREAPGIDLVVRPIGDAAASLAALERGDVDALIGGHLPDSPRIVRRTLFEEDFVCIRDKALAAPLSAGDYVRLPHALFSAAGGDGSPGVVDALLATEGHKRRVAVTLAHVVAVPFAVAGTDLVATMARRVASRFAAIAGVALMPLPYDAPRFAIDLLHSRRATADPALRWFLAMIERVGHSL
ncbi:MAG: LysR family transcriptional regulator [Bosea sp.]|uniref:LysR family transcriptional regulator n=1 Tax=Bosea sp. (in: a-proteobacteria) TaxID=1871050 RepID=UPI002393F0CE|nr:LysR family transcriptional regulator [Bosea sp. (in: a-proteobacteria)]MCP4735355.1 LysR family transcriptional regulator [Bosea sp. (in: a-proteobacteria)]